MRPNVGYFEQFRLYPNCLKTNKQKNTFWKEIHKKSGTPNFCFEKVTQGFLEENELESGMRGFEIPI